jgi:hypothetical protein
MVVFKLILCNGLELTNDYVDSLHTHTHTHTCACTFSLLHSHKLSLKHFMAGCSVIRFLKINVYFQVPQHLAFIFIQYKYCLRYRILVHVSGTAHKAIFPVQFITNFMKL